MKSKKKSMVALPYYKSYNPQGTLTEEMVAIYSADDLSASEAYIIINSDGYSEHLVTMTRVQFDSLFSRLFPEMSKDKE